LREADQALSCNQPGIGASDCFGPHVVLLNPQVSPTGKCRYITAYKGLQVDVARFGDQHGAQADGPVGNSSGAFADVGELVAKPCASMDLEQRFRQIDTREYMHPQREQRGRIIQFVKRCEHQPVASTVRSIRTAAFVGRLAAMV